MSENEISDIIIGCGIRIHRQLGPGLLESVYEECLGYELDKSGLYFEQQKSVPVVYETIKLEAGFRLDFLVERKVVIELKAVESLNAVHLAQVMTYLRLTNCRLGLLMNFNVTLLKDGIRRVANKL